MPKGLHPAYSNVFFADEVPDIHLKRPLSHAHISLHSAGITRVEAVKGCRGIGKRDMKLNDKLPKMSVDPETYEVSPITTTQE